ncbi:MAG: hypothetical protein LBN06_06510 [Prevotellaceae bacterium]|nr:hypothetical protein [Prevotellaceae bacterium]
MELTNADFYSIDTNIITRLNALFTERAPEILRKDCDGIVMLKKADKVYFILCELKSTFDSADLYKAMHQIVSSYIKLNMVLNLLDGYNSKDCVYRGLIVSLPLEDNSSYALELKNRLLLPDTQRYKKDSIWAAELFCNRGSTLKATECEKLNGIPLSPSCLFDELEFHYIDTHGSNFVSIDITSYL